MLRSLLFALAIGTVGSAHAQRAPSASDIASYTGQHLAAHEDNVDEISRLIAAGADLNVRDRSQRTPAHGRSLRICLTSALTGPSSGI